MKLVLNEMYKRKSNLVLPHLVDLVAIAEW